MKTTPQHDLVESTVSELEDEALSFIRALLVASGVYGRSSHPYLSRSNSFGKMISDLLFEQVEESYKERGKESDHLDHKILHDLLNEALLFVLPPPVIFPRKVSGCNFLPPPHGEKLVNSVWGMIRAYVELSHSPVDDLTSRDLESSPWSVSVDAEVIVGEIEGMILADIVDEIAKGMIVH